MNLILYPPYAKLLKVIESSRVGWLLLKENLEQQGILRDSQKAHSGQTSHKELTYEFTKCKNKILRKAEGT